MFAPDTSPGVSTPTDRGWVEPPRTIPAPPPRTIPARRSRLVEIAATLAVALSVTLIAFWVADVMGLVRTPSFGTRPQDMRPAFAEMAYRATPRAANAEAARGERILAPLAAQTAIVPTTVSESDASASSRPRSAAPAVDATSADSRSGASGPAQALSCPTPGSCDGFAQISAADARLSKAYLAAVAAGAPPDVVTDGKQRWEELRAEAGRPPKELLKDYDRLTATLWRARDDAVGMKRSPGDHTWDDEGRWIMTQ